MHRKLAILTVVVCMLLTTGSALAQESSKKSIPITHDWMISTYLVEKIFPGTMNWLRDCSSTEGGHGYFVWRGGSSLNAYGTENYYSGNIPGGWMQFEHTTFDSHVTAAIQEAKLKGFRFSRELVNYYEPFGQALVAGYMRYHAQDRGQWSGWRC